MSHFGEPLDFQGQTASFAGTWGAPLDFAGQTLEDVGNPVWGVALDFEGTTIRDSGSPVWGAPLDFAGTTFLGFGISSVGAYRPGAACVLTVVGVDEAYTLSVAGEAVSVTDDLDVNGNGTITFTATRATAYGGSVEIALTMGGATFTTSAEQLAETGLATVAVGAVVPQWAPGVAKAVLDRVWNPAVGLRGRLYEARTAGTTGATIPSHLTGDVSDGGVVWRHVGQFIRLEAAPDIETGDQIAINAVVGGELAGVVAYAPGWFTVAEGVTSFDFGVWDGEAWGAFATQQILPYLTSALNVGDGAQFLRCPLLRWDNGWQSHQLKRWNGTEWVEE